MICDLFAVTCKYVASKSRVNIYCVCFDFIEGVKSVMLNEVDN